MVLVTRFCAAVYYIWDVQYRRFYALILALYTSFVLIFYHDIFLLRAYGIKYLKNCLTQVIVC